MDVIYLDNNATTMPAPEVVAAMTAALAESWGNPSSQHGMGQRAQHAIEQARAQVAGLIGAEPREIVFTSGGTEADNLAILGTLEAYPKKRHIVTTTVEHPAVLTVCERLEKEGYRVTCVGVDRLSRLDLDAFEAALDDDTALASVMYANNETGVIFPIDRVAEIAAARGVVLHVDAVQAAGKTPIDVRKTPVTLMSLSAHKMHGAKGVGALYVRRGARLRGRQIGGHQERDLRTGTENVPGIVGFGVAAELARNEPPDVRTRIASLRDRLETGILERFDYAHVNGDREHRMPNTTNIGFASLEAEAVLIALSEAGVCVSSGSACSSGSLEPSHVLRAMGVDERVAHGAIRFSLSRYTTLAEVDAALERLPKVLARLAALAPSAA
jgi:cysteine desulfurase